MAVSDDDANDEQKTLAASSHWQRALQLSKFIGRVISCWHCALLLDVRIEKGSLSKAWAKGAREYATVAMRFSALDVTRDSTGRIVDGDVAMRSLATELWTFMRAHGGQWLLSAIQ